MLTRINQVLRRWSTHFTHAVVTAVFWKLEDFTRHRVIRWLTQLYRWNWTDVRRRPPRPDGSWQPINADEITLFDLGTVAGYLASHVHPSLARPTAVSTVPERS